MKSFGLQKKQKAQTILEYCMVLIAIIVPLAMWINQSIGGDEERGHAAKEITKSAFGEADQMGVIGRPYP